MRLGNSLLIVLLSIPLLVGAAEKNGKPQATSAKRAPASIDGVTFNHFYEVRVEKETQAECESVLEQQKTRFEGLQFTVVNGPVSCKSYQGLREVSSGKSTTAFEGYLEMYR